MCPFEKKEKEVFFRLPTLFFRNKLFFPRNNFCLVFYVFYCKKKSKGSKKFFFENLLNNFRKKNFQKFSYRPEWCAPFLISKTIWAHCAEARFISDALGIFWRQWLALANETQQFILAHSCFKIAWRLKIPPFGHKSDSH